MRPVKAGERIRAARELQGLTQSELGRRVGVKPQTVQQWESGKTQPRHHRLEQLARVLRTTATWIAFGDVPLADRDDPQRRAGETLLALWSQLPQDLQRDLMNVIAYCAGLPRDTTTSSWISLRSRQKKRKASPDVNLLNRPTVPHNNE